MTITSISLPVHIHDDATHTIIDADGNVIAVCGPHFAGLDGSGRLLQQAETIAAELVRVLNAHDEQVAMLELCLIDVDMGISLLHEAGTDPDAWFDSARIRLQAAVLAARGEPVS